jgi:transcriptional regulator GlxA family with amidase domain
MPMDLAQITKMARILPFRNFCYTRNAMGQSSPVIAFLVVSPFELLDLTGPASVFQHSPSYQESHYSVQILTAQAGKFVTANGGFFIGANCRFSEYQGPIDTLIVIGGEGAMGPQPPELLSWLRKRSIRARRVASVCTGAFILAAAGLLDGRRVATHWRYCDILISRYKNLKVERDPIYIKDGKFYTTAGVTAGIDLALALVEEDLGRAVAATVARELVLFLKRPGGQAQYSTLLAQQADISDERLRDLPVWVRSHLTRNLNVQTLANAAAMSPRTFARQFKSQFKSTPARWVQSLRVQAAMQYLESGDTAVKKVAHLTGFRDEQALRRAFMQQTTLTPKQYRARFGGERFNDRSESKQAIA